MNDVHDRCGAFLGALVPEVERRFPAAPAPEEKEGGHRRILLCSHAATVIALARELVGDRSLPLRIACCSLTQVKRKEGAGEVLGGWEAQVLGGGEHLKDGCQRDWGFEDIEIANGEVVSDSGVPGTEGEVDEPVGLQLKGGQVSRM